MLSTRMECTSYLCDCSEHHFNLTDVANYALVDLVLYICYSLLEPIDAVPLQQRFENGRIEHLLSGSWTNSHGIGTGFDLFAS